MTKEEKPMASSACPICGKDTPHHHSADEIEVFREVETWAEDGVKQIRPVIGLIDRCEAIENEASDKLATEMTVEQHSFYRGQKHTAKSLRRHFADLAGSTNIERIWQLEMGLRNLVDLLADTGFHNSLEMAAARKLLPRRKDQ